MILYLTMLVSLIGLFIATYTDLKARIVTNKLNFGLALIGLFLYGVLAVTEQNPSIFLLSVLGLCYGFLFGWVLWKLGVFAGGDVKLFMALGALNPITPALLHAYPFIQSPIPLFPFTLFVYSLVAFLPYGLFIVAYKLSKNAPFRKKFLQETKKRVIDGVHFALFSGAMYTILTALHINTLVLILTLIVWGAAKQRHLLTLLVTFAGIIISVTTMLESAATTFVVVVVLYGIFKMLMSLRPLLTSEVAITKLEEGMIPGKTLAWVGKKVVTVEPLSVKTFMHALKHRTVNALITPQKEIISSMKARGLTVEEIHTLKKLHARGLIGNKIPIKESMPFVPTMLLGYILCLLLSDALWVILFRF